VIALDDAPEKDLDCLVSCLPHGASAEHCARFIKDGVRIIDMSADFRLRDAAAHGQWYGGDHPCPRHLKDAVYGLSEHFRDRIASAALVANPGAEPTAVLLALLPLVRDETFGVEGIIADCKSGVSGTGRTPAVTSLFVEANGNISPHALGREHRHVPEIEQELSRAGRKAVRISLAPHLVPVSRGVLATVYFHALRTAEECLTALRTFYRGEVLIRVREPADLPNLRDVERTSFCDITVAGGEEGQPLIAVATLDNLLKGGAGQALQNLNIMFGMQETRGLLP
jgi:N-acetyl-gamma-glutamyl-phosphate reductase